MLELDDEVDAPDAVLALLVAETAPEMIAESSATCDVV